MFSENYLRGKRKGQGSESQLDLILDEMKKSLIGECDIEIATQTGVTTIKLEEEVWKILEEIAKLEGIVTIDLCRKILLEQSSYATPESCLRVYAIEYLKGCSE